MEDYSDTHNYIAAVAGIDCTAEVVEGAVVDDTPDQGIRSKTSQQSLGAVYRRKIDTG